MEKEKLLKVIKQGWNRKQICEFFKIAVATLRYWEKKYEISSDLIAGNLKSVIWTMNKEELQRIIYSSKSLAEVLRSLGYEKHINSALYKPLKKRIKNDNLDITHINLGKDSNKNRNFKRHTKESYIKKLESGSLQSVSKKTLINLQIIQSDCCDICGINRVWNQLPLSLQLDHIDGNPKNNKPSNLRFLCPNCHSQTETFCIGNRKIKDKNKCRDCGIEILEVSKRCLCCETQRRSRGDFQQINKFEISEEDLYKLVCIERIPFTTLGKMFGVSDNSIRKRCKKYNICPKKRIKFTLL